MDDLDAEIWELEIVKVTDPSNFLARQLPGDGKSSTYNEFIAMKEEMATYLNAVVETGEPQFKASLNEICAAHKKDTWHRLRIEEILANSSGQKIRCSLIDVGTEATLNIKSLHRLPAKFKKFPAQVHRCCLSGLQPLTMQVVETENGLQATPRPSKKWDPSSTSLMLSFVKECTKCKARIERCDSNDVLQVQMFFYKENEWLNFNDKLVLEKYALRVEPSQTDDIRHSTPISGRWTHSDTKTAGSHSYHPMTPDSSDSLEMPALSDLSDSDASFVSPRNALRRQDCKKTSESDKELSPSFKKFISNVPDGLLKECPPLPQQAFKPAAASVSPQQEEESGQTISGSRTMAGVNNNNNNNNNNRVNPAPGMSRGRAALLSNMVKKLNIGKSSTQPLSQSDCRPLGRPPSHHRSPANSLSSPPPLSACDSDSFVSPSSTTSSSFRSNKSPLKSSSLLTMSSSLNSSDKAVKSPGKVQSPVSIGSPIEKSDSSTSRDRQGLKSGSGSDSRSPSKSMTGTPNAAGDFNKNTASCLSPRSKNRMTASSSENEIRVTKDASEKAEISQVLADGFCSSSSGVGVRLRERKMLDDVVATNQSADVDKKWEIAEKKKKYLGQQEGRKFLEQLRVRSGLQMISPEEAAPQTTLHSRSQQNPRLGTLVYGKAVPMGLYNLEHVPFTHGIKKVLKESFDKEMALGIETFSWPSILRGRRFIGIGRPGHENTLAYVPALVTLLSDRKSYDAVPRGTSPLALIVVPSWKKVQEVYEVIESFIGNSIDGNKQMKCIPLYAGGTENDHATQLAMMKGYEILVTTPNSFLRKVEDKDINLKRTCHLVVDDIDLLLSRYANETEHIMQIFMTSVKARCNSDIPQQVLIFSKIWSDKIDAFQQRYTEQPVIAFSSRVEASVYGEVKQVVTLSAWGQRLEKFCHLMDQMSSNCQKVVVWTTSVQEAEEISKALSSLGIYTFLIHHEFDSDEYLQEVKVRWHQATQSKNLTVLVATDPCYEDLGITDATAVVHYDIPSRTRFGNRLAVMYQHFSDRLADFKSAVEPVSHIILTERCPQHARSLFDLLKRAKSSYPRQLEDYVRGYQSGLQNEHGKELCPLLKAFGSCQNERCELRHIPVPDVDFKTGEVTTNDLPASGQVKVKVIHVVNSTRLYCHLLQHRALDRKDYTDMKLAYQYLLLEMSLFYSKPSNHKPYLPSDDLMEDGLCGFKDESGTVDRARVLEVREGTYREPMRQCKAWLVDLGVERIGTIDQLVKLPVRLAHVPYQAIEVYVCRIKPVDHDLDWTKKADIFIENLVKDKELLGRIVLRLGLTLWLDPLVHQVKLKGVGAANDLVLRQELLANNFATLNPDHIKSLYELCRGKTEIPENIMTQYFDYCLEIEMTQETLPITKEFHQVNVVGIYSPSLFYVQRWDRMDQMDELEAEIAKEMSASTEGQEDKPEARISQEVGSVCLAESDGKWFRSKILAGSEEGLVSVFHLDFGTREDLKPGWIRPLKRHFARLPCQAIECQLAYVASPDGEEEWPPGVVDSMCNFTQYVDEEQKCLIAKTVSRLESVYTMGQRLVIDLYDSTHVTLSEELVWRHKAIGSSDDVELKPLFGKPALKNQLFFNPVDKLAFLCANIYWCKDDAQAMLQAEEMKQLLSDRQNRWDVVLEERDLFQPLVKLIGYLESDKAHGVFLKAFVACCKESPRLCRLAVDECLASQLNCCIEMVDRFAIQSQALEAVSELTADESFVASAISCELKRTLMTFLHLHHDTSVLEHHHLRCLCNSVAKVLAKEKDSFTLDNDCELLLTLIQKVTSNKKFKEERFEPWLGLLAAVANSTSQRAEKLILKESFIKHQVSLLEKINRPQCLAHLLETVHTLAGRDKKNKTILLEHNTLVVLKRLLEKNLDYPVRCLCQEACAILSLNFPQPETLSGMRLEPGELETVTRTVTPNVTWSESCFRVVLKIRVKNAREEDFTISRNRLQCKVKADREMHALDWELYGDVVSEKSLVTPHAFYTVVTLRKGGKGMWGHLLKNKTKPSNLSADFERLLNSDDDDDDDDENDDERGDINRKKKKGIFDGLPKLERAHRFSSDESTSNDSLALNSSDNERDREPRIDYEAFLRDNYRP